MNAATRGQSGADTNVLEDLATAWAELEAGSGGPLRTLDPEREHATPLVDVHASALARLDDERLSAPLAVGLCALARAQLEAFPANLFWDFDLIAAAIVAEARALAPSAAIACVEDRFARMTRLQALYGRETTINFSYVHDFVYGFDWAKWVAREPSLHADVPGPFSLRFLVYMERRGHELLALIAADDREYPSLPDDQVRNPFAFSREPEAEVRLHRELARRDLIPVPGWRGDYGCCDWTRRWRVPFRDRRDAVAAELGLLLEG